MSLVWIAARAIEDVRWARVAGVAFTVWFGFIGAIVNLRDGGDYRRLSAFEAGIVASVEGAIGTLHEGDSVELVDQTPDDTVLHMGAPVEGRPKLYLRRPGAIHGAIHAADLATIVFARQNYRAVEVVAGAGRRIEIGSGAAPRVAAFRAVR